MRRLLYSVFLNAGLLLLCLSGHAQEKTITGRVTAGTNNAASAGVTVTVKGTKRSVVTDNNGAFRIAAKAGDVLQFSSVGMQTRDVTVGSSGTVNVQLTASESMMGEVVVTAMDIRRNPRELGYSVQSVSGAEIKETQRENFVNSLQGRVAGLTITPTNGQAGASSQIVLRGFNSLSLSNSPLFVIDGIILDNSTLNETSNGGSGIGLASDRPNRNNDYTNRVADINPNDIESVTVLKGPEATALYGSQASSGAIIITTKKATAGGKLNFAYDNSFRVTSVNRLEDLNNEFMPGSNGVPARSFSATSGTYFGPRYPANTTRYDNVAAFFRTGFAQTHNLSADIGFKNTGFKVTGSYFDQAGVIKTNDYKKYNFRITNTTKIGKYVDFTPSFQYINSQNDKPLRGAGSFLLGLYVWPDTYDLGNYADANGDKTSIFSTDPYAELDNPLYSVLRNHSQDKTQRYIYTGAININPFDWLTVSGRFGYDTYNTTGYTLYHPLSNLSSRTQLGSLDNYYRKYKGYNHTVTATAKKTLGKFSGRIMIGNMWQDYETDMFAVNGTKLVDSIGGAANLTGFNRLYKNGQIVTDANFAQLVGNPADSNITNPATRTRLLRNNAGQYNQYIVRQVAYFGEASVSYNNYLFLSYTRRFESASVFPKDLRDYNYPGFSASAIVSDIIPKLKGNILGYWKLRASLASTARLADPYKNQSVFVNNFTSSNVGLIYAYGFDNNNPLLRPERQKTHEFGTEIRLFKNFLSLDVAYYNTLCTDQISNQFRASYGTGFVLNTSNAASTRNQGIEASADLKLITGPIASWNMRLNFNHGWSKVLYLPVSIQNEYYNSDTWLYGNARGGIHLNGTTTTISGFHYLRNNAGQKLINPATGLPVVEQTFTEIGDRNPEFTLGAQNNVRYKNLSLSFLWDLKVGGDIWNATEQYLTVQGKSKRTADRETPRIVEGVLQDGLQNTDRPTKNTIVVVPMYQLGYYTGMPEEEFVEKDVNWLRLRDVTLSYTFAPKLLNTLKVFKSLGVFVTGTDLILITNYRGADPASNGNTSASNGVGGWGFDYGNLPTPRAFNFGLRANFK